MGIPKYLGRRIYCFTRGSEIMAKEGGVQTPSTLQISNFFSCRRTYLSIARRSDRNARHPGFCRAGRAVVDVELRAGNNDRGRSRGGYRLKPAATTTGGSAFRGTEALIVGRMALAPGLRDPQQPRPPPPESGGVYDSLRKRHGRRACRAHEYAGEATKIFGECARTPARTHAPPSFLPFIFPLCIIE